MTVIHTVIASIGGESFTVIGRDPEVPGWSHGEVWFDNLTDAERHAAESSERDKGVSLLALLKPGHWEHA